MAELELCCQLNSGEETCDCQTKRAVKFRHSPIQNYTSAFHPSPRKASVQMGKGIRVAYNSVGTMRGMWDAFCGQGLHPHLQESFHAASSSDTARANLTPSTEPSRGFVLPCTVPGETLPLTSPIPLPLHGSRKVSGAGCRGRDAHNSQGHNPTLRYTNSLLLLSGEEFLLLLFLFYIAYFFVPFGSLPYLGESWNVLCSS